MIKVCNIHYLNLTLKVYELILIWKVYELILIWHGSNAMDITDITICFMLKTLRTKNNISNQLLELGITSRHVSAFENTLSFLR